MQCGRQDERRHPEEDQRGQKCSGYMYILTDLLCDSGLKGAECIFAQIEESSDGKTR